MARNTFFAFLLETKTKRQLRPERRALILDARRGGREGGRGGRGLRIVTRTSGMKLKRVAPLLSHPHLHVGFTRALIWPLGQKRERTRVAQRLMHAGGLTLLAKRDHKEL